MKDRDQFARSLGKKIRAVRESKGISLKEFEVLEPTIDRHALSRIENGKTMPSVYTLFKIATVLKSTNTNFLADL